MEGQIIIWWSLQAYQPHSFTPRPGGTMIKKIAGGYKVLSEKGKNLGGPYKNKKDAEKRLRQVEYFKHNKG
jgi:hypothetical protein